MNTHAIGLIESAILLESHQILLSQFTVAQNKQSSWTCFVVDFTVHFPSIAIICTSDSCHEWWLMNNHQLFAQLFVFTITVAANITSSLIYNSRTQTLQMDQISTFEISKNKQTHSLKANIVLSSKNFKWKKTYFSLLPTSQTQTHAKMHTWICVYIWKTNINRLVGLMSPRYRQDICFTLNKKFTLLRRTVYRNNCLLVNNADR